MNLGEVEPQDNLPGPMVPAPAAIPQVRHMYVTKAMVEKYGMATGCTACLRAITHGTTNVIHSEVCRSRMQERLLPPALKDEQPVNLQAGKKRRAEHRQKNLILEWLAKQPR